MPLASSVRSDVKISLAMIYHFRIWSGNIFENYRVKKNQSAIAWRATMNFPGTTTSKFSPRAIKANNRENGGEKNELGEH